MNCFGTLLLASALVDCYHKTPPLCPSGAQDAGAGQTPYAPASAPGYDPPKCVRCIRDTRRCPSPPLAPAAARGFLRLCTHSAPSACALRERSLPVTVAPTLGEAVRTDAGGLSDPNPRPEHVFNHTGKSFTSTRSSNHPGGAARPSADMEPAWSAHRPAKC